jgi:hypothetical protein
MEFSLRSVTRQGGRTGSAMWDLPPSDSWVSLRFSVRRDGRIEPGWEPVEIRVTEQPNELEWPRQLRSPKVPAGTLAFAAPHRPETPVYMAQVTFARPAGFASHEKLFMRGVDLPKPPARDRQIRLDFPGARHARLRIERAGPAYLGAYFENYPPANWLTLLQARDPLTGRILAFEDRGSETGRGTYGCKSADLPRSLDLTWGIGPVVTVWFPIRIPDR